MDRTEIVYGRHDREKRRRAWEMRRQMTPAEAALWERLRRSQLRGLHFRRQQVIDGFIADFYCHAAGLIVELDGGVHADRAEYDTERDAILMARGLRILRIPNDRVNDAIEDVLAEIAAAALEPARPSLTEPARASHSPPSPVGKGAGGLGK